MLRFQLLGPFQAWRGGQAIPPDAWRTRQTLAVLRILLDDRGRPVHFERLIDLVWPEADPRAAKKSLQGAVKTIRRVLEPGLERGAGSRYLKTEAEAYRLVPEGCSIDVDEFLRVRQTGAAAEARGDAAAAIRAYQEADALYRGEYLADDPYADWALAPRERLQEAHLDVLEHLAPLLAERGEHAAAIRALERALARDPLREELYRELMRCHWAAGRRSHALAAFERCRHLLSSELGVEPSAETYELRGAIASAQPVTRGPALEPATPVAAELHFPFVGRERELGTLSRAWARAGTEAGHLLLVRGSAGMGKTRLAEQFAQRLGGGVRVLWMAAHEAEVELPFAPILGLLGGWLEGSATPPLVRRLGPHAPMLAHLLPQVRAVWPECPPLPSGRPEPSQVLEALTAAVRLLSGSGRALLVLEDLHWSDRSTPLWLSYGLRRMPAGLLVVGTHRTEEGTSEPLGQLLQTLRRSGHLTEVELWPLTRYEVDGLVATAARLPHDVPTLSRPLYELTQGNPLFLVETVRELTQLGVLYPDGLGGWRVGRGAFGEELPVPGGVRDTIRARAARLGDLERDVLTAACVLRAPFRAALAAAVTSRPLEGVLDGLDGLLQRQLLRTTADGQAYAVVHPLVGRVVYDDLSPGRRQRWHRRAAEALQAAGPQPPGVVLGHLLAAGAEDEEMAGVARLAGDQALGQHAYRAAVEFYRMAVDRSRAAQAGPVAAGLLESLAEALDGAGRWSEAIGAYEELVHRSQDGLERSRLRRKMAQVHGDQAGRYEEALTLLTQAQEDLAGDASPAARIERGRVEAARVVVHFYRGEYPAVIELGERVLGLWCDAPGLQADVLRLVFRIGAAEQRMGHLDRAEARYQRALALARAVGDRPHQARMRGTLGLIHQLRGELERALELDEEALRAYRELSIPSLEVIGLVNLGFVLTDLGDLPRAEAMYGEALQLAEALQARYTIMHVLVGLGQVQVRLGLSTEARGSLQRAIALAEEIGNRQRLGHAHLYMAELSLREGDARAARRWAERGIAIGGEIGDAMATWEGCPILAQALLMEGEVAQAEGQARQGLELARRRGYRLAQGRNLLALSQVLWARGAEAEAAEALGEAQAIFQNAGARWDLANALRVREMVIAPP